MPKKPPFSSRVVITVTPVANCDSALRKWRSSNSGRAAVLAGVTIAGWVMAFTRALAPNYA